MIVKKTSINRRGSFLKSLFYVLASVLLIGIPFLGSQPKLADAYSSKQARLSLAESSNSVSVDQLSELYIAAEIANNISLSSSNYLNMDYISATTQYSINQTTAAKI